MWSVSVSIIHHATRRTQTQHAVIYFNNFCSMHTYPTEQSFWSPEQYSHLSKELELHFPTPVFVLCINGRSQGLANHYNDSIIKYNTWKWKLWILGQLQRWNSS